MKVLAALASAALLAACGGGSDPRSPDAARYTGEIAYTVLHYDFTMDITTRRATAVVTMDVVSAGDCLTIPFRPTLAEDVILGGTPTQAVAVVDQTLQVCDANSVGWPAGAQLQLEVTTTVPEETWGPSQVGYSVRNDRDGQPFHYLVSWVGGCDRHGPCDSRPDQFATYTFHVDHPAGTQVLCSGDVTPGETRTDCDFQHAGGPTYSTFAFMASPSWTPVDLGDWAGVKATLYDIPSSGVGAAFPTDDARGFFDWMRQTFGDYPYGDEIRFVVGPTYWNGFEHPGNISLAQTLATGTSRYTNPLEHTTLHEIAHQWAGDQTTLADTYDFVWKEAMAEYLTFVYEDEQIGAGVGRDTAQAWKAFSQNAAYYPVPGERPPLLDYYGDVYGPGPLIFFRQLEAMFGRDKIIAALQSVLGRQRALSVDELRVALEAATGAELAQYFDAWVTGTGRPAWPRATFSYRDVGGIDVEVAVTLATADGKPRGCKFVIQLVGGMGETFDVPFDFGTSGAPVSPKIVQPMFRVVDAVLDPYAECLVYPATLTAWPEGRIHPWVAPPLTR